MIAATAPPAQPVVTAERQTALREAAQGLEAAFLSEMLKGAGISARQGPFGGGAGEDHFASFQRDQIAQQMVSSGGIGLAEQLYQTLLRREGLS